MNRQPNHAARCAGLSIALLLFAPLGQAFQQRTPPPQAAGYTLAFDDEFATPDISPTGGGIYTWYQSLWFWHVPAPWSNYAQSPGEMDLTWTPNQTNGETTVATLCSANRSQNTAFRYGYIEARFKWPVVTGAWPAFWMAPVQAAEGTAVYNGVPETGELDIFEGQGNAPRTFLGTLHDWVGGKNITNKNSSYTLPVGTDFSQFHTYGVLWVPGTVTWYFDNQPLMSAPTPAIFDVQDFYLILGMEEGVNWQLGNQVGVTASSMTLAVNWVRVWQNPFNVVAPSNGLVSPVTPVTSTPH